MDQQTAEWWAIRCGKVTASRIGDLMARNQPKKGQAIGDWSAKRNNYLEEKVAERITGRSLERKRVASLEHRLELEPDALRAYQFYCDSEIGLVGFVEHPRIPNAGASPDGLVGIDGGWENKCPDPKAHIEFIRGAAVDREYLLQCQFGMACTDRKWWDFTSFCPEMPEQGKLFVVRVERDDELITRIESEVISFLAEVEQKVAEVQRLIGGCSPLTTALESSLESLRVH